MMPIEDSIRELSEAAHPDRNIISMALPAPLVCKMQCDKNFSSIMVSSCQQDFGAIFVNISRPK